MHYQPRAGLWAVQQVGGGVVLKLLLRALASAIAEP